MDTAKVVSDQNIHSDYKEVSSLAKYPFEPYHPQKKLKVCVTGAGGFIASHLAKRLKSEGHYVVACDWKRNEHFSVSLGGRSAPIGWWLASSGTLRYLLLVSDLPGQLWPKSCRSSRCVGRAVFSSNACRTGTAACLVAAVGKPAAATAAL